MMGSPQPFCITCANDGHSAMKDPTAWASGNRVYRYLQVWKEKVTSEEQAKAREHVFWGGSVQKFPKNWQALGAVSLVERETTDKCGHQEPTKPDEGQHYTLAWVAGCVTWTTAMVVSDCCAQTMTAGLCIHLTKEAVPAMQKTAQPSACESAAGFRLPTAAPTRHCEWMWVSCMRQ